MRINSAAAFSTFAWTYVHANLEVDIDKVIPLDARSRAVKKEFKLDEEIFLNVSLSLSNASPSDRFEISLPSPFFQEWSCPHADSYCDGDYRDALVCDTLSPGSLDCALAESFLLLEGNRSMHCNVTVDGRLGYTRGFAGMEHPLKIGDKRAYVFIKREDPSEFKVECSRSNSEEIGSNKLNCRIDVPRHSAFDETELVVESQILKADGKTSADELLQLGNITISDPRPIIGDSAPGKLVESVDYELNETSSTAFVLSLPFKEVYGAGMYAPYTVDVGYSILNNTVTGLTNMVTIRSRSVEGSRIISIP